MRVVGLPLWIDLGIENLYLTGRLKHGRRIRGGALQSFSRCGYLKCGLESFLVCSFLGSIIIEMLHKK